MAGQILTVLPNMTGVAAGNTATRELALSGVLQGLLLGFKNGSGGWLTYAQIINDVDRIFITINGNNVYDVTPSFLREFHRFFGPTRVDPPSQKPVYIPLKPTWWANKLLANQLGIGMAGLGTGQVVLNVRLKSAAPALGTGSIEVRAVTTPLTQTLGAHMTIDPFPFNQAAAGTLDVTTLPLELNVGTLALGIHSESGGVIDNIARAMLQFNDIQQRQEIDPRYMEIFQLLDQGRAPDSPTLAQTQTLWINLNVDANAVDFVKLQRVQRMVLRLITTGAPLGNFTVYRIGVTGIVPDAGSLAALPAAA